MALERSVRASDRLLFDDCTMMSSRPESTLGHLEDGAILSGVQAMFPAVVVATDRESSGLSTQQMSEPL